MAQMWPGSLIPWIDQNGDPQVGAVVEFFDANTTTPQVVYTDSSLSTAAGASARTANASGQFGALFLNPTPGSYRIRITADDDTVIWDVDGISVPQDADFVPPEAGETSPELLFKTGMLEHYYGTTAPAGWVRANGRTIGSATSGGTERANADCEDLFLLLWAQDSSLTVSGGRGGTASGDWAANKSIALPDLRGRALVGLDTMGNSAAGVLTDVETLGETIGAEEVTLTVGQMPSHNHGGSTGAAGAHNHGSGSYNRVLQQTGSNTATAFDSDTGEPDVRSSAELVAASNHTHTVSSQGSGEAHSNVQPSKGVTIIIKL